MLFNLKRVELEDDFSVLMIELNTQTECMINTDDFFDEISETICRTFSGFSLNVGELENGNIGVFYAIPNVFYDAIAKDVEEVIEYFNMLNNKIVGLEEPEPGTEQEETGEEVDVENLTLDDYKSMMDAWARDMRDKFVKEANLSKEEIAEQIDDSTKSFVSNMGILAQKLLYISGSKIYADKIYDFCDECRTKGLSESARTLRKFFHDASEVHKERGTQKDLRVAMQLKQIFGDDQEQGIFGAIVSGFYWLYYKVKNYFKNVIQVNVDDNSIIGKIIEGVGLITTLVITGVKIVFTIVGHIISFVATIMTKAIVKLYDAVKNILQKIKDAVRNFKNKN